MASRKETLIYFANKYISRMMSAVVDFSEKEDTPENRYKFSQRISESAIQILIDCGYSFETEENTITFTKPEPPK